MQAQTFDLVILDIKLPRLSEEIRTKATQIGSDRAWLDDLKSKWTGKQPKTEIRVRVGAVASGASVLQSSKAMTRILDQHKVQRSGSEAAPILAFFATGFEPQRMHLTA